jgi:hypothetical protein
MHLGKLSFAQLTNHLSLTTFRRVLKSYRKRFSVSSAVITD